MRHLWQGLAARLRPLVPDAALPGVLAARSLAGGGPVVGLPAGRRPLVVAPHPDDETLACGGTLALLAAAGAPATALFLTDGTATRGDPSPDPDTARRRRGEARAACELLGLPPPRFAGLPDGDLAGHLREVAGAVADAAETVTPDLLLLPWFLDDHPDHRAATTGVLAAGLDEDLPVWGGEVWTPLPPNRLVDISRVVDVKREAIAVHATALGAFDASALLGLNRYRSVHGLLGRGHAEAFLAAPVGRYRELVERAGG